MGARRNPKKLNQEQLWNYALRTLGQRAHSAAELKKKLAIRASSAGDLAHTLSRLREYGFTNDTKFSETFAMSRLQNQGFGKFRVMRDLRAKRVSERVASEAIEKAYAGIDESELIRNFLERKYRGKNLAQFLADEKNLLAAYRRLRTAGFSTGASLSVLKRYNQRADDDWNEAEAE